MDESPDRFNLAKSQRSVSQLEQILRKNYFVNLLPGYFISDLHMFSRELMKLMFCVLAEKRSW